MIIVIRGEEAVASGGAVAMGNKPYAKPLGIHTAIGRAWLREFRERCDGGRLLSGEILLRTDKVVDIRMSAELMSGFTIHTHVLSQNPLKCKQPDGKYTTVIQVDAHSEENREGVLKIIRGTAVWDELLSRQQASVVGTPPFELVRFAHAPLQLLNELALRGHHMPDHQHSLKASCNCEDKSGGWCKHIAAACYVLIRHCEDSPLSFLDGMGIDLPAVLKETRAPLKRIYIEDNYSFSLTISPQEAAKTQRQVAKRKQRMPHSTPPAPAGATVAGPSVGSSVANPVLLECMGSSVANPVLLESMGFSVEDPIYLA